MKAAALSSKKMLMLIASLIIVMSIIMIVGAKYVAPVFGFIGLSDPTFLQGELRAYIMSAAYNPGNYRVSKTFSTGLTISLTSDSISVTPEDADVYTTPVSVSYFIVPDSVTILTTTIEIDPLNENTIDVIKRDNELTIVARRL